MRICIDVDGTICITKAAHESYADATPMPGAIDAIKKLKDAGHYIIIATARGMKTYESNLGRIVANQSVILIDWLNKYHTRVKKNLLKFMSIEEKSNLIDACSPI